MALMLLANTVASLSQTATPTPFPEQWWERNPYEAPDSLNRFLYHAGGKFAFNNSSGNYNATMIHTGGDAAVRQGFTSGYLDVSYSREEASSGGSETSMTLYQLRAYVDWAFQTHLFAEAGFVWQKNKMHLLQDQYLPYLGVGTQWTVASAHQINFFVAGGKAFPTYTVPFELFGMKSGNYDVMYASQYYRYNIRPGIRLDESFIHIRNLNETKRYSTNIALNLLFAISRHVEIMVGYTSSLSTEAGFVGASEVDTGENVGVNLIL